MGAIDFQGRLSEIPTTASRLVHEDQSLSASLIPRNLDQIEVIVKSTPRTCSGYEQEAGTKRNSGTSIKLANPKVLYSLVSSMSAASNTHEEPFPKHKYMTGTLTLIANTDRLFKPRNWSPLVVVTATTA